jgi:hypothetical protein
MPRPRDIPFGLWQSGAAHLGPQTLATVERCRVGRHMTLEIMVSEPIAYLDLHRQQ